VRASLSEIALESAASPPADWEHSGEGVNRRFLFDMDPEVWNKE